MEFPLLLAGADFFTLLVFLVPAFTMVPRIRAAGSVGRRSPLPNIAAALACCVGILYTCSLRDDFALGDYLALGLNCFGASFQICYVLIFIWYDFATRLLITTHCVVPALAYVCILALHFGPVIDTDTLADTCGLCACLVTLATLYNLGKVKVHKSMESMPHVCVPALTLISAPLWIAYSLAGKGPKLYIMIPNCLSLASALLQLGLHGYFWFLGQQLDLYPELRARLLPASA